MSDMLIAYSFSEGTDGYRKCIPNFFVTIDVLANIEKPTIGIKQEHLAISRGVYAFLQGNEGYFGFSGVARNLTCRETIEEAVRDAVGMSEDNSRVSFAISRASWANADRVGIKMQRSACCKSSFIVNADVEVAAKLVEFGVLPQVTVCRVITVNGATTCEPVDANVSFEKVFTTKKRSRENRS